MEETMEQARERAAHNSIAREEAGMRTDDAWERVREERDACLEALKDFSDHYPNGAEGIDLACSEGLDHVLFSARVAIALCEKGQQ